MLTANAVIAALFIAAIGLFTPDTPYWLIVTVLLLGGCLRSLQFTSLTANDETDSDRLLAVAPEAHPVAARWSSGEHRGRAEVSDDGDIHIVHGLMARAPHVAILTCKGATSDEAWALATWRSLRNG